jgi:hypothetical protein
MQLSYLVRRAVSLPPHVALYRTCRFACRLLKAEVARLRIRCSCSYLAPVCPGGLQTNLRLDLASIPQERIDVLRRLCQQYLSHRFDLLGSGWQTVAFGMTAPGLEGHRFAPSPVGPELAGRLNPPNLKRAQQIWRQMKCAAYQRIDWQLDFHSGFRWDERKYFADLDIGKVRGADIKVPWELARLQHLPRLALSASLACQSTPSQPSAEAQACLTEVKDQLLDFISANPPRFGAAWGCPMDVAIRAANICLACSLAKQTGAQWEPTFESTIAASLHDHARHILEHLEWSETGRSNHYMSDIAGLAFIAASLPSCAATDAWLAFALSEVADECLLQFHADGGNYEGSTAYHRLSLELVVFPVAMALGLAPARKLAVANATREPLRGIRVPVREDFASRAGQVVEGVDRQLAQRIWRAGNFLAALTRPDDRLCTIGDVDSGRFFKLEPRLLSGAQLSEDSLHGSVVVGATRALWGRDEGDTLESAVVRGLCGGNWLPDIVDAPGSVQDWHFADEHLHTSSRDDVEQLERREFQLPVPLQDGETLTLLSFPDFGVYVWRNERLFVSLRCAPHAREDAPMGHTHDDNLALEVWADGRALLEDPGTYVYTPLPELRRAYREWPVHFVPRSSQWEAIQWDESYLFNCKHRARAHCSAIGAHGAIAWLSHENGDVGRAIEFRPGELWIADFARRCELTTDIGVPVPVCQGYGRRAGRSLDFPVAVQMGHAGQSA